VERQPVERRFVSNKSSRRRSAGRPHFAYLENADVSVKPPSWTGKKDEEMDLVKGANLEDADLRYVIAHDAFFVKARLERADLRGAHLLRADLRKSDLKACKLDHADLVAAQLNEADLQDASLVSADLFGADLTMANLRGTNLSKTNFKLTEIKFADFRGAIGLPKELIRTLRDHELAFYDPDILQQLGLPPDHNEKLQKQMDAELKQAKSAAKPLVKPK
jgi:hypothetical protein